jgi:hypothetical protein
VAAAGHNPGGCPLHAAYAHLRIRKLEKSKQLQQALYEIADLAGADLELGEMLRACMRWSTR